VGGLPGVRGRRRGSIPAPGSRRRITGSWAR
jgi:hypothetical protein